MLKRWTQSRVWVLAVGVAAILALAALAAGLPNLRFRQPGAFVIEQRNQMWQAPRAGLAQDGVWLERLIIILMVASTIILISALFDKKARRLVFRALLFGSMVVILRRVLPNRVDEAVTDGLPPAVAGGGVVSTAAMPAYTPPHVSSLMAFLAALALVLLAVGVSWYFWRRRRLSTTDGLSLPGLRRIAQSTLDDLSAGQDWRDAVIRCYAQMTDAVAVQRGLVRRPSMTAEEFAGRLTQAGLPPGSVLRLTHLFESARYGGRRSSRADADEAAACLHEIVAVGAGAVPQSPPRGSLSREAA
jgi:uncharacterized protein DUF4129